MVVRSDWHGGSSLMLGLAMVALSGMVGACGGGEPAPMEEPAASVAEPVSVVATNATPVLVQEGFTFTEGPVAGPDGNLYFSDVRESRIHRLLPDGTVELFLENTDGANGLAFDSEGRLVAAQGAGGRIARLDAEGNRTVLAEGTSDDPYAPNDLILDGQGGVYFTDPGPRPDPANPTDRRPRVFHVTPDGDTVLVTDQVARPNGISVTLDGSTLLIADSIGTDIMAMDIGSDGMTSNLRSWASLQGIPDGEQSGADGLAVDEDGRLFVATAVGVQVFGPEGQYLETIEFPRRPSNVAFGGGDRMTLYVTASEGLYSVHMAVAGPASRAK